MICAAQESKIVKTKSQDFAPSNSKFLQSQISRSEKTRLAFNGLAIVHGRLQILTALATPKSYSWERNWCNLWLGSLLKMIRRFSWNFSAPTKNFAPTVRPTSRYWSQYVPSLQRPPLVGKR